MAGMLLTGTANTVVLKVMDVQQVEYDGSKGTTKPFSHPFFQTGLMFLGELCVLGAFYASEAYKKRKGQNDLADPETIAAEQSNLKTKINPLWLAIPGSCDFFGSTTMFVALLMVPASVYQMFRGAIVIITAVLAVIFLKKKQYRHHITSLFIIFLGLLIVGVSSIEKDPS
jgi:drug/metabolite transporter (DMT)-like permease